MQAILEGLQIKQKLSTAFHPQTDGQTERVNSILEQYLRCYINYQQSDWDQFLPIAQFAYNNSQHSSTGETPFYSVYGFHPKLSFNLPRSNKDQTPAEERISKLKELRENMQFNIAIAQETHALYYDRNKAKGPKHKIGDKVWLSTKHIKSQRPTGKLDNKRLGPFKIIGLVGNRSYKLELPHTMRIYPVFHTNLLEPYKEDPIEGRTPVPPPPVIIDEHQEYVVEEIIDSRIYRNALQYLVHWKGYTSMDRTWEPVRNLTNCPELIKDFHEKHPSRPKGLHGARP